MKKLTYAIALSSLLLAGCSKDEGIMESKGELVTLNYNVSLGDGVQSRTGEIPELAVNKLLCAVFDDEEELYRDTVDVNEDGKASFTPKLLDNTDYQIVFWAYYEEDSASCFDLENLEEITVNDNYDCDEFTDNAKKDAFTYVDEVNLSQNKITKNVVLTRPFGQINLLTSADDFKTAMNDLKGTPTTCELTISGHNNVYNALDKEWYQITETNRTKPTITLYSKVSNNTKIIDGKKYYYLANEYLFSSGANATCIIKVYDNNYSVIYNKEITDMPIAANASTNMYNENLLTGGGVTYNISINTGFTEGTNNVTE